MKIRMHTFVNRMTLWALFLMLAVGEYFVYRDAANDFLRIVGCVMMAALVGTYTYIFLFKFGIYDYAVFGDNGIELRSPFKIKAHFEYGEVLGCQAVYTSIIEKKRYFTFTCKELSKVVRRIDTSKYGNVNRLNKMNVIYVPYSERLAEFLLGKQDLLWYMDE